MQGDPQQLESEDDEFFDSHEKELFHANDFSLFACTIVMVIIAIFLSYMFLGDV